MKFCEYQLDVEIHQTTYDFILIIICPREYYYKDDRDSVCN